MKTKILVVFALSVALIVSLMGSTLAPYTSVSSFGASIQPVGRN